MAKPKARQTKTLIEERTSSPGKPAPMQPEVLDTPPSQKSKDSWWLPLALIAATFVSTTFVGSQMVLERSPASVEELARGWTFSVPLMAILLSHEFGHYIAGRLHGVDISPPFFIPMPIFLLGTMGAVIRMRGAIRSRNALLDVGAAGPIAGFIVAIPVVLFGVAESDVRALAEVIEPGQTYIIEGRSLFYSGLIYALKGPMPDGHDIWLTPTALAGWAGLLVTMINLVPVGQLDGGHIAYALFGRRQNRWSERTRHLLLVLGVAVGGLYGLNAMVAGADASEIAGELGAGVHWLVWAGLLWVMAKVSGRDHPPTSEEPLTPIRRGLAWGSLFLFAMLFMPSWIRIAVGE